MANIIPRSGRLIGTIIPDLVIEEQTTDAYEITSHPVQQGASISDHKYKKPITLAMSIQFKGANQAELGDTYQSLLTLQDGDDVFDVTTLKRIYHNMQIKSLAVTTDKETENILKVMAEFQEVIIVSVQTTDGFPPKANQKNPKKTAKTKKSGSKSLAPKDQPPQREQQISVLNTKAQALKAGVQTLRKGLGF